MIDSQKTMRSSETESRPMLTKSVKDYANGVIDRFGEQFGRQIALVMQEYLGESWHIEALRKVDPGGKMIR